MAYRNDTAICAGARREARSICGGATAAMQWWRNWWAGGFCIRFRILLAVADESAQMLEYFSASWKINRALQMTAAKLRQRHGTS